MMKTPIRLLLIAFFSTFIFGCTSTSVQYVEKPDISNPLKENETIIQLERTEYFVGSLAEALVVANDKSIGELANGDELIWKTNSNSLECISVMFDELWFEKFVGGPIIRFDDTPNDYKCFEAKPQEIVKLTLDFFYPDARLVRGYAFTPIFKSSPTFDSGTKVIYNVVNSISPDVQTDKNIKGFLENAIKKQFGDKLSLSSNKNIDIEILEYNPGNALTRWVAHSLEGTTFAKVKVVIKDGEQIVDTFITRPVISDGGFYTVGADEYIFDEVAEDIYLHLFGNK